MHIPYVMGIDINIGQDDFFPNESSESRGEFMRILPGFTPRFEFSNLDISRT